MIIDSLLRASNTKLTSIRKAFNLWDIKIILGG